MGFTTASSATLLSRETPELAKTNYQEKKTKKNQTEFLCISKNLTTLSELSLKVLQACYDQSITLNTENWCNLFFKIESTPPS